MRTDVTVERIGLISELTEIVQGHPFLVAAGVVVVVIVLWAAFRADARSSTARGGRKSLDDRRS